MTAPTVGDAWNSWRPFEVVRLNIVEPDDVLWLCVLPAGAILALFVLITGPLEGMEVRPGVDARKRSMATDRNAIELRLFRPRPNVLGERCRHRERSE
jgi:hypothetical protein